MSDKPEKKSLGGLGSLSGSFSKKDKPAAAEVAEAQLMDIILLEEDPQNVRKKYNETALQDFAETLKECGITSPISVRKHPNKPGMYMLNNGHRRLRAAKIAGFTQVPVVLKDGHTLLMQLSDNESREDVDLLDTADRIRMIATSEDPDVRKTKEQIARALGRKSGWISKMLKILDMPGTIKFYYDLGRLRDLEAIYQLCVNYKEFGNDIVKWLEQFKESSDLITQAAVNQFIKSLKQKDVEVKAPAEPKPVPQSREGGNETNAGEHYNDDHDDQEPVSSDSATTWDSPVESATVESHSNPVLNDSAARPNDDNLEFPLLAESDAANGVVIQTSDDLITSESKKDSVLTLNMEIVGDSLEDSTDISRELLAFIEANFKNKIRIK